MATPLMRICSVACRARVSTCGCIWRIQTAGAAGKEKWSIKYGSYCIVSTAQMKFASEARPRGKAPVSKKKQLEVEEDTNKLLTHLVGGNYFKEGEDPVLGDDSEYPDWLWKLKLDRKPVPLEELSEDDPKYWRRLKKLTLQRQLKLKKFKKL